MEQILNNIKNKIIDIALREDEILKGLGKGIFYMPELAFVYTVGKEISLNGAKIFNGREFEWIRESKVSIPGRSTTEIFDLIFEVGKKEKNEIIVIEFKMRDKDYKYKSDIEKLHKLPSDYFKVFCALEDVFEKDQNNGSRMTRIVSNSEIKMKRIGELFTFPTWSEHYKNKMLCFVEIWQVF
ncbi:MAG: hypothetical protein FVQ77_15585 [Cytophagales bacterium]|nr:hypothetical protein [Cytophagales bacterium]